MEGKEKGDMKKVLVVGSLNMDMVLSVDHHPVPGETIIGDGILIIRVAKGPIRPMQLASWAAMCESLAVSDGIIMA